MALTEAELKVRERRGRASSVMLMPRQNHTVAQLKTLLTEKGLPTDGLKASASGAADCSS